jgi:ATP-dependent protease HslVU (ClpYQ) peptidase subunit
MKEDKGYAHRNADYWEDVKENLSDIDVNASDNAIDGKLIYISIKNYKPSGTKEWDLDNIYAKIKQINAYLALADEDKKLILFGVRTGDVKKLDKEIWINFEEYYVDFGKKLLKKNKSEAKKVHTHMTIKGIICGESKLMELRNKLGSLLENKQFKVDPKHEVGQAQEAWMLAMGNVSGATLGMYHEIKKDDPKWLEENLDEVMSEDGFKDLIYGIDAKYPLLSNIGDNIGSWTDLSEDSYNQNLLDYISMCDRVGDE